MTEVWTDNELMGLTGTEESPPMVTKKGKKTVVGKGVDQDPMLWGVPGHLTHEEVDVFNKFKEIVNSREATFRDTVYSFGEIEGEAWALCRWLRARKFVLEDVVQMVEEASRVREDAKAVDFYPNGVDALGCDTTLFFAQYPQLYTGVTKKGVPVFISKPGILNVDGMECITTLDGIIKFHWHVMMHDFAQRLHAQKKQNPDKFKKFECFCVLDLNGLSASQLSRRALAIIKEQSSIDSVCFPETMAKMLIVNAPTFFSATWRVIKGWLDPRTVGKIEVISSRSTMEKRLLEFIDEDQLASDYGGKGPNTEVTLNEELKGGFGRMESKMFYIRGSGSDVVEIPHNESLEVMVYTRATTGATFTLQNADTKAAIVEDVDVTHTGTDNESEPPTSRKLTADLIAGPMKLKVKATSKGSRFTSYNYLLVFSFKSK